MPKFLEAKLKKQYGADSDIPYKIMNARGLMHGSKITAKGWAAERKHTDSAAEGRNDQQDKPESMMGKYAKLMRPVMRQMHRMKRM